MVVGESRLDLPEGPTAAGLARAFVRRCWSHLESDETLDAVVLCVSELVTNALDHATPPYELCMTRGRGRLRVEVADTGECTPVLQPLSPSARRGRGIFLVQCVATQWGVESTTAGKTVWAEFATNGPMGGLAHA
jgi:anti-sigma regulatory factor (Ser/Thr protein kinase)